MKKLVAVLIATLATTQAFAQGTSSDEARSSMRTSIRPAKRSSGVALMPTLSIGATQVTNLDRFQNQAKAGTGASIETGMLAEFGRGTFVFQTGAMYMHQATSISESQSFLNGSNGAQASNNYDWKLAYDYFGVPLAMKARTRIATGVRLTGRVGAVPMFLMSRKETATGSQTINGFTMNNGSTESTSKDGARSFNMMTIAGFGPEFAIARNHNVRIELGYERMMMTLMASGNDSTALQSLNLMLSYAVGL